MQKLLVTLELGSETLLNKVCQLQTPDLWETLSLAQWPWELEVEGLNSIGGNVVKYNTILI